MSRKQFKKNYPRCKSGTMNKIAGSSCPRLQIQPETWPAQVIARKKLFYKFKGKKQLCMICKQ